MREEEDDDEEEEEEREEEEAVASLERREGGRGVERAAERRVGKLGKVVGAVVGARERAEVRRGRVWGVGWGGWVRIRLLIRVSDCILPTPLLPSESAVNCLTR